MSYRSRALLDLAHRVDHCTIELPGVCKGYCPDGCEPAHSNQLRHGKGRSIKAEDHFHAAACHVCHAELDQGRLFSREDKAAYWQSGFERTLSIYFGRGWIKVAR